MATIDKNKPSIAFISGHTDISSALFDRHYAERIDAALEAGHCFVLGDAPGADTLALQYLLQRNNTYPDITRRLTIYPSRPYNVPRLVELGISVVQPDASPAKDSELFMHFGRRARHICRDIKLTAASDYDIFWVRNEQESQAIYGGKWRPRVSATEMNRLRRLERMPEGVCEKLQTDKTGSEPSLTSADDLQSTI